MANAKLSYLLEKQVKFAVLNRKHFVKWLTITKYHAIAHLPDKENLISTLWQNCALLFLVMIKSPTLQKKILSIPEFRLKNKWTTLLDKLSILSLSTLNMEHIILFQILLQELILRDKAWQPYWTPAFKELSETLLSPTEIDYVGLDSTLLNYSLKKVEVLSQSLMMKETKVPNKNLQKTYYQLSTSTVVDKWVAEATEPKKILKAVKIPIKQSKMISYINEWINTSNYVYNKTLEKINKGHKIHFHSLRDILVTAKTKKNNKEYKDITNIIKSLACQKIKLLKKYKADKKKLSQEELEKKYKKEIEESKIFDNKIKEEKEKLSIIRKTLKAEKNDSLYEWELKTPKEIRAAAVNDVCKAFKTGFENLKKGNIRFFKMKYRKHLNTTKSISIQKNLITIKDGLVMIAPDFTNKQCKFQMGKRTAKKHGNIEVKNDVRLVKERNNYFLYIPVEVTRKEKKYPENYCGIDPGVKTYMTLFTNNGITEYKQNTTVLKKLNDKIKRLKKLRIKPLKQNQRNRYRKRKILKIENRKSNIVDEFQWKIINDLVKTNDVILYGDIKSHNIVKGKNNHKLNQDINDLKFYKFKLRLQYKMEVENKLLYLVPENHTTKTCSGCGNIYEIGLSRVYNCSCCGLRMGRDENSGKNILMKGIITNL